MNKERRKEVIESYVGLVDVVIDALLSKSRYKSFKYLREELKAEGYVALIEAIDSYKPDKGTKPVTYLSMQIRHHIGKYLDRSVVEEIPPWYIEDIDFEIADEKEEYNEDWIDFVDHYEPEDEIERRIYHEILMGDTTYKELADEIGSSKKAVRSKTQRLKKKLKKQIEGDI